MKINIDEINLELSPLHPSEIVQWAKDQFENGLVMTSGFGAESAVMIHLVTRIMPTVPIILIDTSFLRPETYVFAEQLREHFGLNLKIYASPIPPEDLDNQVEDKLYHEVRKIEPMRRALFELSASAVMSGIRSDQTENRANSKIVQRDSNGLYRIHPILTLSQREIEMYMTLYDLPYHPLVKQGFWSIGDIHNTFPGKNREGRKLGTSGECGLNVPNYSI